MARTFKLATILFTISLAGCGNSEPSGPARPGDIAFDAATSTVSYRLEVAPIFAAKCVGCHHRGSPVPVDLTNPFDAELGAVNRENTWASQGAKRLIIAPGAPDMSALMDKVAGEDLDPKKEGAPMPLVMPSVTAEELQTLETWIQSGAKDDDFYRANVTLIFGDGATLGGRAGKCAFCHSGDSPFEPDLVNPFDPERGAVGVPSAYGGLRIVPGDPQASVLMKKLRGNTTDGVGATMPKVYPRLSAEEVDTLRTWITEGAQDN